MIYISENPENVFDRLVNHKSQKLTLAVFFFLVLSISLYNVNVHILTIPEMYLVFLYDNFFIFYVFHSTNNSIAWWSHLVTLSSSPTINQIGSIIDGGKY